MNRLALLKTLSCTTKLEKELWKKGIKRIAGVDEVGRGSLFGPVVSGAVILDPKHRIRGLRDSKLMTARCREELSARIKEHAIAWAVASVSAAEIDRINIYQASRLAMRRAVEKLKKTPDYLLVDALKVDCDIPQQSVIHGDALSASIAAASIVAKVAHGRMIDGLDLAFPEYAGYGLSSNSGYPAKKHLTALREFGATPLHRKTFGPVKRLSETTEAVEQEVKPEVKPIKPVLNLAFPLVFIEEKDKVSEDWKRQHRFGFGLHPVHAKEQVRLLKKTHPEMMYRTVAA